MRLLETISRSKHWPHIQHDSFTLEEDFICRYSLDKWTDGLSELLPDRDRYIVVLASYCLGTHVHGATNLGTCL